MDAGPREGERSQDGGATWRRSALEEHHHDSHGSAAVCRGRTGRLLGKEVRRGKRKKKKKKKKMVGPTFWRRVWGASRNGG
jgi:hypothetical protein